MFLLNSANEQIGVMRRAIIQVERGQGIAFRICECGCGHVFSAEINQACMIGQKYGLDELWPICPRCNQRVKTAGEMRVLITGIEMQ